MSASAAAASGERRRERGPYRRQQTNPWKFCLMIGFWAGLIWGLVHWLMYTFRFTPVLPGFLAEPFYQHSFLQTNWGHISGVLFFILFSIAAAFLYKILLGRSQGPWAGFIYGLLWWTLLFVAFGPLLGMTQPVNRMGWDGVLSELCLFAVWGVFIGYSIAFEFTDEASREPRREE
ncbi:YqhR family membrane protein [Paenibacillus pasadenensis]|uniref:YqhR family membrane protein n=1 Tax=Paenibacillus pasadenensis TaxID=217090 RepID=UPI00203AC0E5|nr:YqhR family membrane protein [Paenibacillus pasadenensis]MCM3747283.1 YqhR family membrane protein [Paenibacillus pasadenensis]